MVDRRKWLGTKDYREKCKALRVLAYARGLRVLARNMGEHAGEHNCWVRYVYPQERGMSLTVGPWVITTYATFGTLLDPWTNKVLSKDASNDEIVSAIAHQFPHAHDWIIDIDRRSVS